ncbi:MAG: hypothetical protein ABIH09_02470 [Candidatus Omnitrophota bacterium]
MTMRIRFKNYSLLIIKITLVFDLFFSSTINVQGESFCDNLSPGFVSSEEKMTYGDFVFSESVFSDTYFLYFALLTHKTIIKDKQNLEYLLNKLNSFKFWENFKYKKYLTKNFVFIENNIVSIKFKDNSLVRVIPAYGHNININNGTIEDNIVPEFFYAAPNYIIQYLPKSAENPQIKLYSDNIKHMTGFGPELSYSALNILDEVSGLYITVEKGNDLNVNKDSQFVCKVEPGAPERARELVDLLNQGLISLNNISAEKDKEVERIITNMKRNVGTNRIYVYVSDNLNADSAYYESNGLQAIVFNRHFLDFLYEKWDSNHNKPPVPKSKKGREKYHEEQMENIAKQLGAMIMLTERLFHEIDHDEDEVEQILKNRLYYMACLKKVPSRLAMIKKNVFSEIQINRNRTKEKVVVGEYFGTNDYFRMIHEISKMSDMDEIRVKIKKYLEEINRKCSSQEALNFTTSQSTHLKKILLNHNIEDDLFGEKIFGMKFSEFFRLHGLFADVPHKRLEISKMQKIYIDKLLKRRVNKICKEILKIAEKYGYRKKAEDWISVLNKKDKQSLYPVILWAVRLIYPQNLSITEGKLFNKIHYEGLNLLTVPIFPVNAAEQIDWEMFDSWAYKSGWGAGTWRKPPDKYYYKKKISLYEFISSRDCFKDDEHSDFFVENVKKSKIDNQKNEEKTKNKQKTLSKTVREVKNEIDIMHSLAVQIDQSKTIGKITHILIDEKIPALTQSEIITLVNKNSRDKLVSEKIFFIDVNKIEAYAVENNCTNENTVVFMNESSFQEGVSLNFEGRIVTIEQQGVPDFVNLTGLIALARAIINKDSKVFLEAYQTLTNKPFELVEKLLEEGFSCLPKIISLILPRAGQVGINDQPMCNKLLRESLKSL